jgi:hypothetical protein
MNDASLYRAWANSRWTLLMKICFRLMWSHSLFPQNFPQGIIRFPALRVLHAAYLIQD